MKKLTAFITALVMAVMCTAASVCSAAFEIVGDSETAVKKNKELFMAALKKAEITTDFTKEELEDMIMESCVYSADKMVGTNFLVEKFRIVSPTATANGYVSAVVFLGQDDYEDAFEIKKEISASGSNSGSDVSTSDGSEEPEQKYTDAEISAMKKSIEAAKSAINAANYKFEVTNDTTLDDVLKMAKAALPSGSDVEVTLDKANFKLTKASSTVEGSYSASLMLTCGGVEAPLPIGKTIQRIVTETSKKIDEDRSAVSKAIDKVSYNNKTTADDVMKAARAAVKNGSSVDWKDNYFTKLRATFDEEGDITCYITLKLGDEAREIRLQRTLPVLVRKIPSDKISVNKEEWEILRITNVERANVGVKPLTMLDTMQRACDIREPELIETFSHTRPNGKQCFTAFDPAFKYSTAGENIYQCPSPGIAISGKRAMTAWMNSDGHRENLLAGKYNYIGTGTYDADKSGSALQLFAGLNESISTSETSAGTTHFADVDALETEYLICTSTTGLVSYVPLDIDYMTKTDDGYRLDLYGNSVSFTLDDKNVYSGFERGAQAQTDAPTADVQTGAGFSDVSADAYYAEPVLWAVDKKITTGTTSTKFSPADTCTRAQIITFLWRAVGSPKVTGQNPFNDVSESDYYYNAALWAKEKGMVTGLNFKGDTPCKRSDTVTYLWIYSGSPQPELTCAFKDVVSNSAYAKAVSWAVEKGITSGVSALEFAPETICSRGQIVTFLYRALH